MSVNLALTILVKDVGEGATVAAWRAAMSHRRSLAPSLVVALLLTGCAARERPAPVAVAPPPPPPAAAAVAALPEGASPGMLVPEPLADGSFPTPNRQLSAAGTVWHLRAGLNVAALSCGGEAGAAIRAGYNGWLVRERAALATVQRRYAGEYRDAGYDQAMTRLYNFWSQTPVRPAFCAAAAAAIAAVAGADAERLQTLAPDALAALDRPFVAFYRAYDAWRRGAPGQPVIAAAAVPAAGPAAAPARPATLVLDLASLPVDAEVAGRR